MTVPHSFYGPAVISVVKDYQVKNHWRMRI